MLPNVGFGELALILIVGLLLFGADKLPKVARGLGEALKAFRDELQSVGPTPPEKNGDEPSKKNGV